MSVSVRDDGRALFRTPGLTGLTSRTTMGELLFSFLTGIGLGGVYFAGLWETVRKLPDVEKPVRRIALSYALRMTLVLSGFYFVMQGEWERLAAAMVGFLLMRELLLRRLGKTTSTFIGGMPYGSRGD
jgi:F1F0 ATPase subunit 2